MSIYRILSFDGGGIRGLVTLALLKRLQAQVPGLIQNASLLAGTSTGGIIALGLAAGKSVDDMIALYRENGEEIFDDSWFDNIRDLGGLAGADYDQKNLGKILRKLLPGTRLEHLQKRVLIPTFDLDNEDTDPAKRTWKPKFFHNFPGPDSDGAESVVDVALRTSAAPTYFPTYDGFIDGGVVANNPSMAAVAQTQDPRTTAPQPAFADVRVLSLGTGTNLSFIKGREHDWGLAQWAKPLIGLLMDASMGIADYQCRQILRDAYRRVAPVFPHQTNIKLDEWERAEELLNFGNVAPLNDSGGAHDDVVAWLRAVGW
ncbi:MAG: patatin-like phospholipase family protein [Opitutaceae bacterium]|nr:patatin-like phospholipase family protein [Opitutaceae bacterium]